MLQKHEARDRDRPQGSAARQSRARAARARSRQRPQPSARYGRSPRMACRPSPAVREPVAANSSGSSLVAAGLDGLVGARRGIARKGDALRLAAPAHRRENHGSPASGRCGRRRRLCRKSPPGGLRLRAEARRVTVSAGRRSPALSGHSITAAPSRSASSKPSSSSSDGDAQPVEIEMADRYAAIIGSAPA